jgi:hypothetical protein
MTDWKQVMTAAGLPVVDATEHEGVVNASFTRGLTPMEWATYLTLTNPAAARQEASKAQAAAIPGWATWDETQAQAWVDTNIGNPLAAGRATLPTTLTLVTVRVVILAILTILDQMLVMLWSMARLVIALRNKTFPNL